MTLNKEKLISVLKEDIIEGRLRLQKLSPMVPSQCVMYYIINDEIQYIQSLIDVIEVGTYDVDGLS